MNTALKYNDPEKVRQYLNKILAYEKFKVSNRMSRFITYVVEETLNNREEGIKAYTIALEVFDRDSEFDAQSDPIVRIYGGRLRQALKEYYLTEGKDDTIIIRIPKGTYVPVFLNSSDYNNVYPANNADRKSLKGLSKKTIKTLLIAITIITASTFFIVNALNTKEGIDTLGKPVIKINNLENLSSLKANEHFSKRLIEQTKIALGQFSSIIIDNNTSTNRNSVKRTGYTMSGSVQQKDDIYKVTVNLVDNKTNIQVFSKEYNESINTNASEYIEELFANKIAVDLADEFGELQKLRLRNAKNSGEVLLPHEAVLLYYDYLTYLNEKDNDVVLRKLSATVEEYGEYEPAWAAISGLYLDKYLHFGGDEKDLALAQEAVEKAEMLNPRSGHVQKHLAFIAYVNRDLEGFYDAAEKQMALNPNSTMLGQIGLWYCLIGDYDKGIPLIEQAKERNPYYPRFLHFGNYFYYYDLRDFNQALSEAEKVRLPYLFWDPLLRVTTLVELDRNDEAKIVLKELLALRPQFKKEGRELIARALFKNEHQDKIIAALDVVGLSLD